MLNSKLNILNLDTRLEKLKIPSGTIHLISKFSENIKSEMDMQIPMEVEIRCLCDGPNRDGFINLGMLTEGLPFWSDTPIIDWHDDDKKNPTKHKISDRGGYLGDNQKIQFIDGKNWIISDGYITDRYLAYLIYLADLKGKNLEISPEFAWNPIRPHLITITDQGHLQGNKLTIKSAS